MEKAKALLKDIISEDYQTLEESVDCLAYRYTDAYEQELIEVNTRTNRYGVTFYTLLVERTDFDNEIITPESCHDCSEDCQYYGRTQCNRTDKAIQREIDQWKKAKEVKARDLTLSTSIVETECHLNVSHHHAYRGFILMYETTSVDRLKDVLNARDILFGIYQNILRD